MDESDTACTPDSGDTNHDQTHGLDGGWYADADFHWRKCAKCGEEYGKEAHQFDKKESGGLCKDCGHKFFDVKISDGNGLDQSAPTIAEAFAWIETNGVAGRTYTVTLTHNRSDTSSKTVTVPAGYTIVLDLAGHTVTYTNGNLSIEDGSLEIKGDENAFKVKAIVYGGGTLKLPAGEYNFEIKGGYTCLTADITVGTTRLTHKYPSTWQKNEADASTHKHSCEYCGTDETATHNYPANWTEHQTSDTFGKHTRTCPDCQEVETADCTIVNSYCSVCKHLYSATEVLTRLFELKDGETMPGTYQLTGIITEIVNAYDSKYQNVSVNIKIDNYVIECYRMEGTGVDSLVVGNKITVSGSLVRYVHQDGVTVTYEFNEGCKLVKIEDISYSIGVTVTDPDDATNVADVKVNETTLEYGKSFTLTEKPGETVTISISITNYKYRVDKVTANGIIIDAQPDGTYKFVVQGETEVEITFASKLAPVEGVAARLSFEEEVRKDSEKYNDYNKGLDFVRGENTWNVSGFSNNNYGWDNIRTGRKGTADNPVDSDAYIAVKLKQSISKVVINISHPKQPTNGWKQVTTFRLIIAKQIKVSEDKNYITGWTDEITIIDQTLTSATGEYTFEIPENYRGTDYYYIIQISCSSTVGDNGFIGVEYVNYYGLVDAVCDHDVPEEALIHHEGKSETCTEDGYKEMWECPICGKYFNDKACTDENTEKKGEVITKHDHSLGDWQSRKTSDGTYQHYKQCDECGDEFETATCTPGAWQKETSRHYQLCTECGQEMNEGAHTYTKDPNECDVCKKANPTHVHVWDDSKATEYKAATCTEPGTKASVYCKDCKKTYTDKDAKEEITDGTVIQALGHNTANAEFENYDGTYHAKKCETCSQFDETTKEPHNIQYRQYTVGGDVSQEQADYYHEKYCPDCDYSVQDEHDFSGKQDCKYCQEPICKENQPVEITAKKLGVTTSYGSSSSAIDIDGVSFEFNSLMSNSNKDYLQGNTGRDPATMVWNSTPIPGVITKIVLVWSSSKSTTGYIHINVGKDSSVSSQVKVSGSANIYATATEFDFDVSDGYQYFQLTPGKNAFYIESITIYYTAGHHVVKEWQPDPEHPATCLEKGMQQGTCERCGELVKTESDMLGHNWQKIDHSSATCTDPAYVDQWYCTRCKMYVIDAGAEPSKYSAASETSKIVDKSINNGNPFNHMQDGKLAVVQVEAGAEHKHICLLCGADLVATNVKGAGLQDDFEYTDVSAAGHTFKCNICGWTQTTSHNGPCDDCGYGKNAFEVGSSGTADNLADAFTKAIENNQSTITLVSNYTGAGATFSGSGTVTLEIGTHTFAPTSNITVAGSGTLKITGAMEGVGFEIQQGTLNLQEATVTNGTVTMTVTGSTAKLIVGTTASTFTSITVNVSAEYAENAQAEFTKAQSEYNNVLHVTGGAICENLKNFKFAGTPIDHSDLGKTGFCDICNEPIPQDKVIAFTFSSIDITSDETSEFDKYTETVEGYTLNIPKGTKVYRGKNHTLKLGSGSAGAKLEFDVPENVKSVNIYVAQYSDTSVTITVNEKATTLSSGQDKYECISVDTTETHSITLTTSGEDYRARINKIEWVVSGSSGGGGDVEPGGGGSGGGADKEVETTITFACTKTNYEDTKTVSEGNISITLTFGKGSYSSLPSPQTSYIKFYSGNTLKIDAGERKVLSVAFTFTSGYSKNMSCDSGTFSTTNYTWTADSNNPVTSVTLTNAESAQARITTIIIKVVG